MAEETENLRELIKRARYVLFDFDGPMCRLFARHSAKQIAVDQIRSLEERQLHGLLTEEERNRLDPHGLLRAVDHRRPGLDLVAELEEKLTQQELAAVASAWPTEYADPLIMTWYATGARLAVTTNNSARAVHRYLEGRGLSRCFGPHIYGRTRDLHLLKPHPHCLNQAMDALGADPSETLMIGDTPSDFEAAERAGVGFLGYARDPERGKVLTEAGATCLVTSMEPLLRVLRGQSAAS
ncbi:hydrolase [Streptomyces longisporoflavus]|uniref:HAD family hydrolase n=1 Tax=Streptomyces longisporoflavus TaxID=28044 RepID=UPI00198BD7F4|nr:HAD-IA family hydrolase [Streptomyces longisporoflavus]GGV53660.1 hydrolase [Streptomyces longisporoflavus]